MIQMKTKNLILILFALYASISIFSQDEITDTLIIEEAVISGNRVEVARKNVPLTISDFSDDEIEESSESAILPVISQRVPGVFVTEKGVTGFGLGNQSSGQISIRGVGGSAPNTQVLILVDGHPQYMGIFGHPIPDAYVASDVEKVEVVRGPASILYGSNAMGGVINIITKKQEKEGFSGDIRAAYGSFNTQKYLASGGFRKNKFSIFASINHDRTDGHRDSSDFKIINGFVKSGYQINKHYNISIDFNIADIEQTDPGSTEILNSQTFHVDAIRGKTSIKIQNNYDKLEGGLIAFYNFGRHDLSDGWKSTDANSGINLYQGLKLIKGNRITIGIDYKKFGGEGNSGMAANVWNSITEAAGYTYIQQILFTKLVASGGLRFENNSKFGNILIPQIGFAYHLTNLSNLKASFSKGFRSPTVMETYLFMPNPDLEPEELFNYEISFNQSLFKNKLNAEICAFYIDANNFIQLIPNTNPPPPMKRANTGSFENYGIEFELNYKPISNVEIFSNYSWLNISSPKLAAPKQQFFIECIYKIKKIKISLNFMNVSGLYTQLKDESQNLDEQIEDYCLLNAKAVYFINDNFEVFLAGKNLFNTKYNVYYGYNMPGINFITGINCIFGK